MAYGYRRSITTDHNKVQSTDQTNFPVLLLGTYADLKTVGNGGKVQNTVSFNGQTVPADLKFTSDIGGTTLLSWEVASYTASTGDIEVHVLIPTPTTATDYVFYMFYGDSGVTTYQGGSVGAAWNSAYKGVWHLSNGSTLSTEDSTSNTNDGTNVNSVAATTGKIDGGALFDNSTNYISIPYTASLGITGDITISAWAKKTSNGDSAVIFSKTDGSSFDYDLYYNASSNFLEFYSDATSPSTLSGSTALTDTTNFHLITFVRSGSSVTFYQDTTSVGSGTMSGSFSNNSTNGNIGTDLFDSTSIFPGTLDEVRLSNTARSADWITTEYNNQSSPSTFYTLGSETTLTSFTWQSLLSPNQPYNDKVSVISY